MIKKTGIVFALVAFAFFAAPMHSHAQFIKFEFGQDGREVEQIVHYLVTENNKMDSYGNTSNSRMSWDSRRYDGKITEVVQCVNNAYYIDLRAVVDYCKRYVMNGGKLSKILLQFENVSTGRIKKFYDGQFHGRKVGELYFSETWRECSKVYLSSNGLATLETSKVNIKNLTPIMRTLVVKNMAAYDLQQRKNQEQDSLRY